MPLNQELTCVRSIVWACSAYAGSEQTPPQMVLQLLIWVALEEFVVYSSIFCKCVKVLEEVVVDPRRHSHTDVGKLLTNLESSMVQIEPLTSEAHRRSD